LQRKIDALCPQPFNTLSDRRMQHASDLLQQGHESVTDEKRLRLSQLVQLFAAVQSVSGQSPRDYGGANIRPDG
jgi:hypothetical protein